MKFAKRLESEAVPEWRPKYLQYKQLKKLLNSIRPWRGTGLSGDAENTTTATVAGDGRDDWLLPVLSAEEALFFERYANELEKIEEFYMAREAEATKRREAIIAQLCMLDGDGGGLAQGLSPTSKPPSSPGGASDSVRSGEKPMGRPKARARLKKALLEYYRSLELLKNFQVLNSVGCAKILKKFDKTASRCMSDQWIKVTREYRFFKSRAVDELLDHVEHAYCSLFTRGNRVQALRKLRVKDLKTKSYYGPALYCGLLLGLCLALLCHIIVLLLARPHRPTARFLGYIYFALGLPLLLGWLFGLNAYIWDTRYINYRFIFEFNQRNNLHLQQYGALAGSFAVVYLVFVFLSVGGYLGWLLADIYQPWIALLLMLVILLWPLDHFYRSSRRWLLKVLYRVAVAPVYPCRFKDFFVNDQYMSLLATFEALGVLLHYTTSRSGPPTRLLFPPIWYVYLLQAMPGLWRSLQCCRRFHDSRMAFPHLVNLGKYVVSVAVPVAVGLDRMISARSRASTFWLVAAIKAANSLTSLAWDITMDFGLWQRGPLSGRPRDTLIFEPWVYWYLVLSDTLARLAWIAPLVHGRLRPNSEATLLIVMGLSLVEVLRRFQWNIFRVEYEHVNNCNMLRATADIKLPFATTADLFYQDMVETTVGQGITEGTASPLGMASGGSLPLTPVMSDAGSEGDDDDDDDEEEGLCGGDLHGSPAPKEESHGPPPAPMMAVQKSSSVLTKEAKQNPRPSQEGADQ